MKVILLDIDDTLMDFDRCAYFAIKQALLDCGYEMEDSFFDKFTVLNNALWKDYALGKIEKQMLMNMRWKVLFEENHIPVNYQGFDLIFQEKLKHQWVLVDGAKELVEYLSSKYDLYTASNGVSYGQRNRLEKSGLKSYFKGMFISEDIGYPKPKKEFFDYCFQKLDCSKDQIMIIGDSIEADILGGIHAGIKTCWVNMKNKSSDIKPDYEVHSLYEIKKIL